MTDVLQTARGNIDRYDETICRLLCSFEPIVHFNEDQQLVCADPEDFPQKPIQEAKAIMDELGAPSLLLDAVLENIDFTTPSEEQVTALKEIAAALAERYHAITQIGQYKKEQGITPAFNIERDSQVTAQNKATTKMHGGNVGFVQSIYYSLMVISNDLQNDCIHSDAGHTLDTNGAQQLVV